jgi:homogentisate 1,2-dioxygenase
VEKSLGAERTDELAVMVDTFRPLNFAAAAQAMDDPAYPFSWLE